MTSQSGEMRVMCRDRLAGACGSLGARQAARVQGRTAEQLGRSEASDVRLALTSHFPATPRRPNSAVMES